MDNHFLHTRDNLIFINDFVCDLEDFVKIEKEYTLPEGFTGREYIQGSWHRVYTYGNEEFLGKTWKEGDDYISKLGEYKSKIESKMDKHRRKEEAETLKGITEELVDLEK